MLVDSIGDVTITNDGATILRQLEVEHPAGKVLVELAHLQDKEVMCIFLHFIGEAFPLFFSRFLISVGRRRNNLGGDTGG